MFVSEHMLRVNRSDDLVRLRVFCATADIIDTNDRVVQEVLAAVFARATRFIVDGEREPALERIATSNAFR